MEEQESKIKCACGCVSHCGHSCTDCENCPDCECVKCLDLDQARGNN
jgi:hypothetical protein